MASSACASPTVRPEVMTLFVPGIPRERFVLELLEVRQSGPELTPEEWAEFHRRHDQYMV